MYQRDGMSRWRRKQHDGSAPERDVLEPGQVVHRTIRFAFHPMKSSTLCTVITTDRNGHDRWDRRNGTLTLGVGVAELQGLDMADVLRVLLREALENLS